MSNKSARERVVITGMGIVAPNAHGLPEYEDALRTGRSGIRFVPKLEELKFSCQVGGIPQGMDEKKHDYFSDDLLRAMNSSMIYAGIAAIDCWRDAGLPEHPVEDEVVDWDTGAIVGTGIGGADTLGEKVVPKVDAGSTRRLGSTMVEQTMASAVSARIGGLLGLGGQVTTNSSACSTGTEAIIMAYERIRSGQAKRMLAGGAEGHSHYIWAGFDAMRVLGRGFNDTPEKASRPMSASTGGFIPGSGAGILMLESLESALERGATIYAEILGGSINSGGQRGKGSMTAPNPEGVRRCIRAAIDAAGIKPQDIDLVNGHLTGTMADPLEVENWRAALDVEPAQIPYINGTKSLIGHGLGAAGGMECVAAVLQLHKGFIHGSVNCEDLHPDLAAFESRIVRETRDTDARILAKASFGFGDVNACTIFARYTD
ncbi:beta-ketoacyl-[acyl-carrier-protein] synthase family protein [Spirochaeta africana]|uniref:3-oxoacyl-[acyl-carrier-protein] synthase 1 n=1 Tax=Spirochaeta africana (strain ATCC 700263 / DSM 8902 / Z-7692) TaxID=889378 RepID=H9ULC6_SPIAZ|nr:beta-ketoacyl-[acyl-carrier-protein] synthase family protein [Spirochaeta africana]AFG38319.1 3-oxoacyl-(acyl-carrier-protein) synthase [Spirochaeta africana DSM 8902]